MTCRGIGLTDNQALAEVKKIKQGLLYKNAWQELRVKFDSQVRKTLILKEKFVPMWLAQINITPAMQRKNPETAKKLLRYQLEAADVLHNAFMGTEEAKQKLFDDLGLKGEIIELKEEISIMSEKIEKLIDNSTINTHQQQKLTHLAKSRVGHLLGGARSPVYKAESRKYFKNLWLEFCEIFRCSSYKDLNPQHMSSALDFIRGWEYN